MHPKGEITFGEQPNCSIAIVIARREQKSKKLCKKRCKITRCNREKSNIAIAKLKNNNNW